MRRPLSFVVVRFSDEYEHNILRSPAVSDPLNQLVAVDNTGNLSFQNLSLAINFGLDQAVHPVVVVVHEDVYLAAGWHDRLETSLRTLEAEHDPSWGMVGAAGWTETGTVEGHWKDPRMERDTLAGSAFREVERLDEHLLVLHRSSGLRFDPLLPSIHNLGLDLALTARTMGLRTYVVDAPTIHKFADEHGNPITAADDSPKLAYRQKYRNVHMADLACADEYLEHKWPGRSQLLAHRWKDHPGGAPPKSFELPELPAATRDALDRPTVLLSRGGSGSRLLSVAAQDCGLHLGAHVNVSGDSMDMVMAVYQGVIRKYQCLAGWQRDLVAGHLRFAGHQLMAAAPDGSDWGFKLPEAMLLLDEIDDAFPAARYLHLVRDPLAVCLRRTHMTARLDNQIGRLALTAAYRHAGLEPVACLDDPPAVHMAYTTRHQVEAALARGRRLPADRYLEVRFEDLVVDRPAAHDAISRWLDRPVTGELLERSVDEDRAATRADSYPPSLVRRVEEILAPLRADLGYAAVH